MIQQYNETDDKYLCLKYVCLNESLFSAVLLFVAFTVSGQTFSASGEPIPPMPVTPFRKNVMYIPERILN